MTASCNAGGATTRTQFTGPSPAAETPTRLRDREANTPVTRSSSLRAASRAQPDPYDHAQAQVFITMLTAEIKTVSALVDGAEQLSRTAARVGQGTARLWHNEEARSQRKLLYELHRQLDALRHRFPDAPNGSTPEKNFSSTVDHTPHKSGSLKS